MPRAVSDELWSWLADKPWLVRLLVELSSNDGLGHHFGEGLYQFWITADDLKARRFAKVELTADGYLRTQSAKQAPPDLSQSRCPVSQWV